MEALAGNILSLRFFGYTFVMINDFKTADETLGKSATFAGRGQTVLAHEM